MRNNLPSWQAEALYDLDKETTIRKALDNSEIKELYRTYLIKPRSKKAHTLLHTFYKKSIQVLKQEEV